MDNAKKPVIVIRKAKGPANYHLLEFYSDSGQTVILQIKSDCPWQALCEVAGWVDGVC